MAASSTLPPSPLTYSHGRLPGYHCRAFQASGMYLDNHMLPVRAQPSRAIVNRWVSTCVPRAELQAVRKCQRPVTWLHRCHLDRYSKMPINPYCRTPRFSKTHGYMPTQQDSSRFPEREPRPSYLADTGIHFGSLALVKGSDFHWTYCRLFSQQRGFEVGINVT